MDHSRAGQLELTILVIFFIVYFPLGDEINGNSFLLLRKKLARGC